MLRGGRWLLGFTILAVLLVFFTACGVFTQTLSPSPRGSVGGALFFSVTIAYIVPMYGFISERTATALTTLAPVLDADAETVEGWRARVFSKPARWLVGALVIAGIGGLGHNLLLYPDWQEVRGSAPLAAMVVGTQLVWLVLTVVVAALLDNAVVLYQAGRRARVQPFDVRPLRPFASVAVSSTLALVGAQAAFPIMSIEGGVNPLAYVPGLLATGGPMLLTAALPVWPVHRRLVAEKRRILAELNTRIGAMELPDPSRPETLTAFTPLLAYRREVEQVPQWPFDLNVLSRLGLYLIIPPLTWVGAAIIEHIVDTLL